MLAFAHLIDSRSAVPQQPSGGSTSTASASGNSRDRCGGQPFDFAQKAKYFALDVTTELSFGEPFGDMATDSDVHGYIKTTERTVPVMVLTTELPWLVNVLELGIIKRFLPSDKDLLGIGKAMGCVFFIGICVIALCPLTRCSHMLTSAALPTLKDRQRGSCRALRS